MREIKEPGLKRLVGLEGKGNRNSIISVDFFCCQQLLSNVTSLCHSLLLKIFAQHFQRFFKIQFVRKNDTFQ
jgi:hypothetical protein